MWWEGGMMVWSSRWWRQGAVVVREKARGRALRRRGVEGALAHGARGRGVVDLVAPWRERTKRGMKGGRRWSILVYKF